MRKLIDRLLRRFGYVRYTRSAAYGAGGVGGYTVVIAKGGSGGGAGVYTK